MARAIALALLLCGLSPAADPAFRFQNNFWVNLHHFVRGESRRRSLNIPVVLDPATLKPEERAAWSKALDAYSELAKLNLIFDQRLIRINNAVALLEGDSLPAGIVEPEIAAALKSAAPVYRNHLWERHRGINEDWIVKFAAAANQRAPSVTKALASAYHVNWPEPPILVDLACEAGPNEAYTIEGPPGTAGHTVISAPRNHVPEMALEIIFHEASHTIDAQIINTLQAEAERQKVHLPDELWHAVIFYTTGEIVKRELGKQNDPTYQPFAYRAGIYDRGDWAKFRTVLERDWQPYLDSRTTFESAVHDLVRDAAR